jgi:hypothetical protein
MKLEETAVDIYHQLGFFNEILAVEPEIARPCANNKQNCQSCGKAQ